MFAHEVADHPKHKRLNIEAVRRQLPRQRKKLRSPAARHPHKQNSSDSAFGMY
jgi:hypothetical protein